MKNKTVCTQPIDHYLQKADELAQDVVNAWGSIVSTGNAASLTDEFKSVFDKAHLYQTARRVADNHRQNNILSEQDTAEEKATRQAFAESYKTFWEKHQETA